METRQRQIHAIEANRYSVFTMPKRSIDATATAGEAPAGLDRPMKATTRTHSENQERAYIAASRRADRSIEARVQSARMASDIHKRRTGKGFKVSEEIVLKEEMYEEEEDDLPRQYRAFTAGLQGSELRQRAGMYVTTQVAMHVLAREQEVNKAFAEAYPGMEGMNRRMSESRYWQGVQQQQQHQQGQQGQQQQPQFPSPYQQRHSIAVPPQSTAPQSSTGPVGSPVARHASMDSTMSPPGLTTGSAPTDSSDETTPTPDFADRMFQSPTTATSQIDPALSMGNLAQGGDSSIFTTELPQEIKDLAAFNNASFDFSNASSSFLFGGDGTGNDAFSNIDFGVTGQNDLVGDKSAAAIDDYFSLAAHPGQAQPGQGSAAGTPGGNVDTETWNSLFDFDQGELSQV